jgi:membrane protein insertase Oxa1/YidC/SpoIIIJ
MRLLKTLILIFILLTTYLCKSFDSEPNSAAVIADKKELRSVFEDKLIEFGRLKFIFNEKNQLIYIVHDSEKYKVELSGAWLNETVFTKLGSGFSFSNNTNSLNVSVNNSTIVISSTSLFDFSMYEKNTGQEPPFYSQEGSSPIALLGDKSVNSTSFVVERKRKENVLFLDSDKQVGLVHETTARHHALSLINTNNISVFVGDDKAIAHFEKLKRSNNFVGFTYLDEFLHFLISLLHSQLLAVITLLLALSIVSFPLERFISDQNTRLDKVKPIIKDIKNENIPLNEQTTKIQALYKSHGVKGVFASIAFSVRISLMLFCIWSLYDVSAIEGMSFWLIDDFHRPGDGWMLAWLLPVIFIVENIINASAFAIGKLKNQIILLSLYVLLSVFVLTPLIVLVIIYFSIIRFVVQLLESPKSQTEEHTYVANIVK